MITERVCARLRRFSYPCKVGAAALGIWFGAVVALTALAEPTSAVLVLDPGYGLAPALGEAGAALAGAMGPFLQVQAVRPGFVGKLYAHGALLVLPMPAPGGCIVGAPPPPLSKSG
jgi:hypothetical protein